MVSSSVGVVGGSFPCLPPSRLCIKCSTANRECQGDQPRFFCATMTDHGHYPPTRPRPPTQPRRPQPHPVHLGAHPPRPPRAGRRRTRPPWRLPRRRHPLGAGAVRRTRRLSLTAGQRRTAETPPPAEAAEKAPPVTQGALLIAQ